MLLHAGTDEGVYAWVSANYALGTLQGDPTQTTGIVELGGASAQVPTLPLSQTPRSCERPCFLRDCKPFKSLSCNLLNSVLAGLHPSSVDLCTWMDRTAQNRTQDSMMRAFLQTFYANLV